MRLKHRKKERSRCWWIPAFPIPALQPIVCFLLRFRVVPRTFGPSFVVWVFFFVRIPGAFQEASMGPFSAACPRNPGGFARLVLRVPSEVTRSSVAAGFLGTALDGSGASPALTGLGISEETRVAIATMESIDSLGEGWSDGGRRCYICGCYTLSPLKLDVRGEEQPECPHVACTLKCYQKLYEEWIDIKYELVDLERELPRAEEEKYELVDLERKLPTVEEVPEKSC